jgi:hypothetical protein
MQGRRLGQSQVGRIESRPATSRNTLRRLLLARGHQRRFASYAARPVVRHPDLAEVVAYRIICICMFHSPKVQYTLFTHGPGSAVNVQSGAIRVVTASARSHSRDEGKKFGIERCSASRESQLGSCRPRRGHKRTCASRVPSKLTSYLLANRHLERQGPHASLSPQDQKGKMQLLE